MFKGVVHANARAVLLDLIPKLPGRVINICSGNFTLETTFRMNGYKGRLEGCDVSLYTCALGAYFSGQNLGIKLAKDVDPDLEVFRPMFEDPQGQAAAVAILLDMSEHAPRRNAFQQRYWKAMVNQAQYLYEGTRKRLLKKRDIICLDHFNARDGVEVINDVKDHEDTFIISFPPTYDGGYEKLYNWLESVIEWPKVSYSNIGQEADFARLITSGKFKWALGTEYRNDAVEAIVGQPIAQASRGAAKNVYLYSHMKVPPLLVRRKVECAEEPKWPRLSDLDKLDGTERITFHRVTFKEANYFRQLYSSAIPMQAAAKFCYVFCVGGKVFGQVMLSLATHALTVDGAVTSEYLYLMSDLPISVEKHPRLSKLVLACLTSKELQAELSKRTMQSVTYVFTTAFSHKPASMKYRGSFELHSKKQNEQGVWAINYLEKMGQKRVKALYTEWFQKHYSKVKDEIIP